MRLLQNLPNVSNSHRVRWYPLVSKVIHNPPALWGFVTVRLGMAIAA
jgi:hypothetical protein